MKLNHSTEPVMLANTKWEKAHRGITSRKVAQSQESPGHLSQNSCSTLPFYFVPCERRSRLTDTCLTLNRLLQTFEYFLKLGEYIPCI